MKQGYFVVNIGYAPAPAVGEPNPTEPDSKARIFVTTQGPDDQPDAEVKAQAEADVRDAFERAKPDQFIIELKAFPLSAADYATQKIMNLAQGKKRL